MYCIGCQDADIDCDDCQYCNHDNMQCRRVVCKCELPACSDGDSPQQNPSGNKNDPISCSTQKTAYFATLNSAAHCTDETEVQCRDGYVYFEHLADVRYFAI